MLLLMLVTITVTGQTASDDGSTADKSDFVPMVKVSRVLDPKADPAHPEVGDSIPYVEFNYVYVYPPVTFKSKRQQNAYMRLVKNVKRVLPLAKQIRLLLIETSEMLETLPSRKAKEEHMKKVEREIVKQYKPEMKKLTYSQGKLLIKLVDRECNSTAYEAMQAFLGPVRTGVWQAFAWMFGASLKKGYDADGTDRLTERVVLMVEAGQL
jgi:hypothetical protein